MSENESSSNTSKKLEVGSPEWNIAFILNSLADQAEKGGKNQADVENSLSMAGPYWPKERWGIFCARVKQQLLNNGYPAEKADLAIAKATKKVKLID